MRGGDMAEKLFRDPLYDYITIPKDSWLLKLINCREVQRLRYISQLGLSQFTYPGATHSRFSHCLGVYHLMNQCVEHLERTCGDSVFGPGQKDALLAAALLHDVGHAPFSHATEDIFGNHEDRAVQIITDSDTDVHKVLTRRARTLPSRVAALIDKKGAAPLWQKSLISSQLDMDRLDYLRRDSLCSGAEYGNFDCFRIIHTMQLIEKAIGGKQKATFVVWADRSKYALEEYIFSRFYMYQSVYFHHTTRGFERLLERILKCAQDIARHNKEFAKTLLPPMKMLLGGKQSRDLGKFQSLLDHVVLAQLTIWQNSQHKVLRDLSQRLLSRKGIAWIQIPGISMTMTDKITKVRDYLQSKGVDDRYYFFGDEPQAPAYKPYRSASTSEEQSSVNSIILHDPLWTGTGFCEIAEVPGLERLQAITRGQSPILRYYFPEEHKTQIKKLLR
jgi:HD superfamily phosphohydrolase